MDRQHGRRPQNRYTGRTDTSIPPTTGLKNAAGTEETGMRLNKYIASTGFCSRRAADELISELRVTINGRPATMGDRVTSRDVIRVDGTVIRTEDEVVCLMLHKPVCVVSTARDPQGRKTVLDFVPDRWRHLRLYPVGRLDYLSEGLLLLTNDGELANLLTHPSHNHSKIYEVLVRGQVTQRVLRTLRGGMTLAEGDVTAPCRVEAAPCPDGDTLLTFTLHQGLNRQIRRMCRDTGLMVLRLKRVAEGGLPLGSLAPGQTRLLGHAELDALKNRQCGVAKAGRSS